MFKLNLFNPLTITKKILTGFFMVSLIPLLVVGYILYWTTEREVKREILNNLSTIANSRVLMINDYVEEKERDIAALARNPLIITAMQRYNSVVHERGMGGEKYKALDRKYRAFLTYFQDAFGYRNIYLVCDQGYVVFSVDREDDFGTNLLRGPYKDTWLAEIYRKEMRGLDAGISDFRYYAPSGKPAAFIGNPVVSDGGIIGVVMFQLDNSEIYTEVQNYSGLGKSGEIVIASRTGDKAVFLAPLRHDPDAAFNRTVTIGSDEALPIQKAVQGESGSGMSVDYRNRKILAAWRYLSEPGWGMVIKIDTAEAYAHIYDLRKWLFTVGMLAVVVVIFTALRISRSISEPLKALHRGSEIIGGGNLDYKVGTDQPDEIGQLSRSFDKMTINLKNTLDKLEDEVAERKKAEESLRLVQFSVDNSGESIFWITEDARFANVNKGACRNLGYSREELLSMTVPDVDPDFSMSKWREHWVELKKAGTMIFETHHKHKNGAVYPVEVRVAFMKFGDSEYNFAFARDITDRRKAEEIVRAERERLFSVLEKLPAFVYLQAPDYTVHFANRHFREQFGEPEGKFCHQVLWGKDQPCETCPTFRVFETKAPQVWEWDETPNGRIYEVNDYPFTDIDGSEMVLELGFDITERKLAEKQVKKSLKEKDMLLREVHHRVKNNMAVISSLLRLQADKVEEEKYREMFTESINRIKSMTLIHEKLYRTEEWAKINFSDYINDMIDNMYRSYGLSPGRVGLEKDLEKLVLGIETAVPCGLIINELVSNALKHAFPEGRSGKISVSLHVSGNGECELTVADNGVGIPEDLDIENADSLGLTLIYALSEQLRGRVELNRERGTSFTITFRQ